MKMEFVDFKHVCRGFNGFLRLRTCGLKSPTDVLSMFLILQRGLNNVSGIQ